MSMEENNPSSNLGQASPIDVSASIEPLPSNPFISPLLEALMSKPMESPMLTVPSAAFSPPTDATSQIDMGNQHFGLPGPFVGFHSLDDHLGFISSPSLTSLLFSNQPTDYFGQLGFNSMSEYPMINQVPIFRNTSIISPLPSFPTPSLPAYHLVREAPPDPQLQRRLPINNFLGLGNQASYINTGYKPIDPYLDLNPSRVPPIGNHLDLGWDRFVSFITEWGRPVEDPIKIYRCSICRVQFPTPQAYGGHMSSHSKAKKARDAMEATVSQPLKKAKLNMKTSPVPDKGEEFELQNSKMMNEVSKEEKILNDGNLTAKGAVKEAERSEIEPPAVGIETEIMGYKSDESVNSEFHTEE